MSISSLLLLIMPWVGVPVATADILRGNATRPDPARAASARQQASNDAADAAHKLAQDRLRMTTQALTQMKEVQIAAQAAARSSRGVADGLAPAGLQPDLLNPRWEGANLPRETQENGRVLVDIKQTERQARLNWSKFDVGNNTTLRFDQSAGEADAGKWIAFNQVNDPSGNPSQILGRIQAQGQVYVINQNGIIFGAGSQVNVGTLVASALPINENLIQRGILNQNRNAAEFLFAAPAAQGAIHVEPGATIATSVDQDGSGGRVILTGPNVSNRGIISTPGGQTILAAGLEIGFDAHSIEYPVIPGRVIPRGTTDDPSLRGIDVYVGNTGANASVGTAVNSGIIEIPTGSLIIAGKRVEQNGVVDSLTTVTLNGRIDLLANYNAVPNPSFDPEIAGQLAFLSQSTGVVRLGEGSVTRILPDFNSPETTVGTRLPIASQINIQGNVIQLADGAMIQAPSANIAIAAGEWRPLAQQLSDKFAFTSGQIVLGANSFIDASGSTEVPVPIGRRILEVELRGSELAVSPLQRDGPIRGLPLTIDTRRTGAYNGRYWIGTPLGDAVGFLNVIPRTAAELTADGGSVLIQSGASVISQANSVIDVSGGFYRHEGGAIQTTRLRKGNRIIDIADATPDQTYDGIFTAQSTRTLPKYGISETYALPLAPLGKSMEQNYIEGAGGGELTIAAPALALDGNLVGKTVLGPLQLRNSISNTGGAIASTAPSQSSLKLLFEGERQVDLGGVPNFFKVSPNAPHVSLGLNPFLSRVPSATPGELVVLPQERKSRFTLPEDFFAQSGFGFVEILNRDGEFSIPEDAKIDIAPRGGLKVAARKIHLAGDIRAPSGDLDFTAHHLSPYEIAIEQAIDPLIPQPQGAEADGLITVASTARLDTSGLITDDRSHGNNAAANQIVSTQGGRISIVGFTVNLEKGSVLDVSGGIAINPAGRYSHGNAGSITIWSGQDVTYPSVLGGRLTIGSELRGFAGSLPGRIARGGSLDIKAPMVQIGGTLSHLDRQTLLLDPSFFNEGGFQSFVVRGIGAPDTSWEASIAGSADPNAPAPFRPAILLTEGTVIEPIVRGFAYQPQGSDRLREVLRPEGLRPAATVEFRSSTIRNSFRDPVKVADQGQVIVRRGDIVLEKSSAVRVEPGGSITVQGSTATLHGTLEAPGGTITLQGDRSFPLDNLVADLATSPRPTVHISPTAQILARGAAIPIPDIFGRSNFQFLPGGRITVAGNIIAEAGALLDVSGTSGIRDAHPMELGLSNTSSNVALNSPLGPPYSLQTVPLRVDTDGGSITLAGHEMFLTDATLRGRAGGPSALGGTLAVSSGRFTPKGLPVFGDAINLTVTQSDPTIPKVLNPGPNNQFARIGIGRIVRQNDGSPLAGQGYFAINSFVDGGFDSLDLGYNTEPGAGLASGGNVEFRGPVDFAAPGFVRLASGGILRADSNVNIKAGYLAIGQPFRATQTPQEEQNIVYFEKDDGLPGNRLDVAPTFGSGSFAFQAPLIDIGTVVFRNTRSSQFDAPNGDIRGSGLLNIQGDLRFAASKIYPASMANFTIAAYNPPGGHSTVSFQQVGRSPAPLSAGGNMRVFGGIIHQAGTLLAPFGSITLGWDGLDTDPDTVALVPPANPVVGNLLTMPTTRQLVFANESLTSVSGIDFVTGHPLLIPFGISPDGLTIIDPTGINVTTSGMPEKRIVLGSDTITLDPMATIDLRGGGELFASRWIEGLGGPVNLLGTASRSWNSGTTYNPGDLVFYRSSGERFARMYSARSLLNPNDFDGQPPVPGINRYWSEVPESYAIVPDFSAPMAPIAFFSTTDRAQQLSGNPGLVSGLQGVSRTLRIGDTISLDPSSGFQGGSYTLLPRAYALLPGAHLVSPRTTAALRARDFRALRTPEGANLITGTRQNAFHSPVQSSPLRSLFEVLPDEVLGKRVKYEVYELGQFITDAAVRNEISSIQDRPRDAGYLGIQGNNSLRLDGIILASGSRGGRGGSIDISSFSDITIGQGSSNVSLDPNKLNSYGADSLLVGGIRRVLPERTTIDVRTSSLTIANQGSPLRLSELVLVSRQNLTFAPGSVVEASGPVPQKVSAFAISGDGTAALISQNPDSTLARTTPTSSILPLLTVGAGASIRGTSVVLDSSNSFDLASSATIDATSLKLGAGQISFLLNGPTPLTGQLIPGATQLVLTGGVLDSIRKSQKLHLVSYTGAIDLYGPGSFQLSSGGAMVLESASLRGFNQLGGTTSLEAGEFFLLNPSNTVAPVAGGSSGRLSLVAGKITMGDGAVAIQGFNTATLRGNNGILLNGLGTLSAQQNLTLESPLIAMGRGSNYRITAQGALNLEQAGGTSFVRSELGGSLFLSGNTVRILTEIAINSGRFEAQSVGDLLVGGRINAKGTQQTFYDLTRYSDGGEIILRSQTGDVRILAGGSISVGAAPGGGNAGFVTINAGAGQFIADGTFDGLGGTGGRGGSFALDANAIPSLDALRDRLRTGGFSESQEIRLRTGDITIAGTIAAGNDWKAGRLVFSADSGNINVLGDLDASGIHGGIISLIARGNVTLNAGSILTASGRQFNSAGQGGAIYLEAGASVGGTTNPAGRVQLLAGSLIDLSVAAYKQGITADPNGSILDPTSSAFGGEFQGTLHLRAPQISGFSDIGVDSLLGTIRGASSVLVEGYRIYTPAGGVMNTTLRNQIDTDAIAFLGAAGVGNANETAIRTKLLAGAPSAAQLDPVLVLAPGAEIINPAGDLVLGLANPTGSTSGAAVAQAHTAADWDLSGFRYGTKRAPGVLTLRASEDLIFNNTLSDGFTPVAVNATNGFSRMWLAPLTTINPNLPVNTQSWSYRLTAGADLASAKSSAVLPTNLLTPGKGSVLVGEFYPEILNPFTSGTAAGAGVQGKTANSIRFVNSASDSVNRGTRFEVVRTGTGNIAVNAGLDVQLRNQFATIYTAGVALPDATRIFNPNDFVLPITRRSGLGITPTTPDGSLGVPQQNYDSTYSMAGGNLSIHAGRDIGRFTFYNGAIVADTSRQLPTNWLDRRGYVDENGLFGLAGVTLGNVNDISASTTWWINFSNFFQGFGTLGGGDLSLFAERDLINADAMVATNARMAGRREVAPGVFVNLAPSADNLLELGGGDLTVRAGRNISGGSYYVERGEGSLLAGSEIQTNFARSPSRGILAGAVPALEDSLTWLPTTLFVGKSSFDVTARGNILLGPVTNPFLLPQGMNNRFWYKTQFNTFSPTAGADVISYGGSVTHRLSATLDGDASANPILYYWTRTQNVISPGNTSNNQPWLRLAESSVEFYRTMFTVGAPNLRSTSLTANVNIVGNLTLYPSPTGTLEIVAAKGVPGIQQSGVSTISSQTLRTFTSAIISQSNADPARIPGINSPLAFLSIVKSRQQTDLLDNFNLVDPLSSVSPSFIETGATEGADASVTRQSALNSRNILHSANRNLFRIYAMDGDIAGLTVYAANASRFHASRDISDIAFYLQNPTAKSLSVVSAGRDITLFNESYPLRSIASERARGNIIVDPLRETAAGTSIQALSGDLQISGPGELQVLAGRNLDLGTGANLRFGGLGRGITSIGRARNPFLPIQGANLITLAGVAGSDGRAAASLLQSTLNFPDFIEAYVSGANRELSRFSPALREDLLNFSSASPEKQASIALAVFFEILRESASNPGSADLYAEGYAASDLLFGGDQPENGAVQTARTSDYGWSPWRSTQQVESRGEIFTRVRDIRTTSQGDISILTPRGGIGMAPAIFGNPLTPPGIVTQFGGKVSIFMDGSLDIGLARIFTLRGGDLTIWSSNGNIAAGAAAKTVVSAPPTRVFVDRTSALVRTDLGGLATGGGIGVLASVKGVEPGSVSLIAPRGTVDAGDAGIRATGDITIAAAVVVNADNVAAGGVTVGAAPPAPPPPPAPAAPAPSNTTAATTAAADSMASGTTQAAEEPDPAPSIFTAEVIGYGGGDDSAAPGGEPEEKEEEDPR